MELRLNVQAQAQANSAYLVDISTFLQYTCIHQNPIPDILASLDQTFQRVQIRHSSESRPDILASLDQTFQRVQTRHFSDSRLDILASLYQKFQLVQTRHSSEHRPENLEPRPNNLEYRPDILASQTRHYRVQTRQSSLSRPVIEPIISHNYVTNLHT